MSWIRLRAIGLSAWCAFFVWLWVSGEMVRYLGPRTYWVIPFGAITLGIVAVAHIPLLGRAGASAGRRELGALAMILAPILLVVAVPSPQLGTLAASRRTTFGGGGGPVLAVPKVSRVACPSRSCITGVALRPMRAWPGWWRVAK